jgi:hypothetical protein
MVILFFWFFLIEESFGERVGSIFAFVEFLEALSSGCVVVVFVLIEVEVEGVHYQLLYI